MELIVSDAALEGLSKIDIPDGHGLRIDAELTGG
jgi:hypothetical protein